MGFAWVMAKAKLLDIVVIGLGSASEWGGIFEVWTLCGKIASIRKNTIIQVVSRKKIMHTKFGKHKKIEIPQLSWALDINFTLLHVSKIKDSKTFIGECYASTQHCKLGRSRFKELSNMVTSRLYLSITPDINVFKVFHHLNKTTRVCILQCLIYCTCSW